MYRGSWDMLGCKNSSKHFYQNIQCIFWLNWGKTSQLSLISFLHYHITTYTAGFCLGIFPLFFYLLLFFSLQERRGVELYYFKFFFFSLFVFIKIAGVILWYKSDEHKFKPLSYNIWGITLLINETMMFCNTHSGSFLKYDTFRKYFM